MRALLPPLLILAPAIAQAQDLPVMADGMIIAPPDCTALLTVQSEGCFVRNVMLCGDAKAPLMVTVQSNDRGMAIDTQDIGLQTLDVQDPSYGWSETLETVTDRFDVRVMVATGVDTFDSTARDVDGVATRQLGERRLTGQEVTIDSRQLQIVHSTYRQMTDGMPDTEIEEIALYDPSGRFLLVERYFIDGAADPAVVMTPVDFISAADPGLMSAVPLYGCPQ